MLYRQCSQCESLISLRYLTCPQCGHKVITMQSIKQYVEKSRLRLAMLCICLILFVGLGWFVRIETGSRWPLFIVFFLVAPLVPWILKLAYGHASIQEEQEKQKETNRNTE